MDVLMITEGGTRNGELVSLGEAFLAEQGETREAARRRVIERLGAKAIAPLGAIIRISDMNGSLGLHNSRLATTLLLQIASHNGALFARVVDELATASYEPGLDSRLADVIWEQTMADHDGQIARGAGSVLKPRAAPAHAVLWDCLRTNLWHGYGGGMPHFGASTPDGSPLFIGHLGTAFDHIVQPRMRNLGLFLISMGAPGLDWFIEHLDEEANPTQRLLALLALAYIPRELKRCRRRKRLVSVLRPLSRSAANPFCHSLALGTLSAIGA